MLSRSALRQVGERITREAIFTDGSDINILLASQAAMADTATRALANRLSALYLKTARREDLDRLVGDRFSPSIQRKLASAALVTLSLSRTGGGLPAGVLGTGTRIRTPSGVEFGLLGAAAFALGSTGPVLVTAQCTLAGLAGNVAAQSITDFVAVPFDPELRCTNPEPAAGGAEIESDDSLRERAANFFRTARRGTLEAIEFGALTVAGVARCAAVELMDPAGIPSGFVDLYIVDQSGQANAALAIAVYNALVEYRAAGVVVRVIGAQPVFQSITYRLRYAAGVNSVAAREQIRFLTVAELNTLRPSQTLERSLLTEICRTVPGVIVLDDAIASPAGDVVPLAGQVLRTSPELISFV